MPAGEIERLVTDTLAMVIANIVPAADEAKVIQNQSTLQREFADRLKNGSVQEKRKLLMDHKIKVQIREAQVLISFRMSDGTERTEVQVDAKLAKQGRDLKLTIPATGSNIKPAPDPTLQKLVAKAFSAQELLLNDKQSPALANYSRRYLGQLVRVSWLAPDIIASIMDGTQPVDLTGRKLTRANAIPLDWSSQRKMFGFA